MSNAEEKSSKASTDMLPLLRERNFNFVELIANALKINYQRTQFLNSAMETAVI